MKAIIFLALLVASAVHAGPRSSADFTVPADTADAGGRRTTSASYTHDASLGGAAGIATAASPAEMAKTGYIGQLAEVTGLTLTSGSSTVNEGGTMQLAAWQDLDDATQLAVPGTAVAWSVAAGALDGISASGLATADAVYQNTAAVAQGAYGGFTGILALTVLDIIPDNFGTYAGDGLGDAWQVQFFGIDSPDAGPLLDPDGDGQENRFEFIAGLIPTDPQSFFSLAIEPVAGDPLQRRLVFSPCLPDRNYQVLASTTLLPDSWFALTDPDVSQTGDERTVIDTQATGGQRFYRVEVAKP